MELKQKLRQIVMLLEGEKKRSEETSKQLKELKPYFEQLAERKKLLEAEQQQLEAQLAQQWSHPKNNESFVLGASSTKRQKP
jgi:hypothetical protein